jgi:hypothetical protein
VRVSRRTQPADCRAARRTDTLHRRQKIYSNLRWWGSLPRGTIRHGCQERRGRWDAAPCTTVHVLDTLASTHPRQHVPLQSGPAAALQTPAPFWNTATVGPIAAAALSDAAPVSTFVPQPRPSTAAPAPGQTSGSQARWHAQRELRWRRTLRLAARGDGRATTAGTGAAQLVRASAAPAASTRSSRALHASPLLARRFPFQREVAVLQEPKMQTLLQ